MPGQRPPRGKGFRIVFGLYLALTVPFIVWTTKVVVDQIFYGDGPSRPTGPERAPEPASDRAPGGARGHDGPAPAESAPADGVSR